MKLVIIFGPHAVGKMTVGQELAKITPLKLFHNHMSIEGICDIFAEYPDKRRHLTDLIREEVFRNFVQTDAYGMIFTYMWAFDAQSDWDYIAHVEEIFADAEIYFVELEADRNERRIRNHSENRLLNKPSQRNLERSDMLMEKLETRYRLNSLPGELDGKAHYLRIENTNLSPSDAAELIRNTFDL